MIYNTKFNVQVTGFNTTYYHCFDKEADALDFFEYAYKNIPNTHVSIWEYRGTDGQRLAFAASERWTMTRAAFDALCIFYSHNAIKHFEYFVNGESVRKI